MLIFELTQSLPIEAADDFVTLQTSFFRHSGKQRIRHDITLLPGSDQRIGKRRIVSHGQVRWQSPRSRRPDEDECIRMPDDREFNIDARADVIRIFNLSVSQRGPARNAPVNWFFATI